MSTPNESLAFWNRLLSAAELIEEQSSDTSLAECKAQLDTIGEAFGELCDPVEHFEPYVTMKLIRAITSKLAALD
jgi:hypothetical protein